MSFNLRYDIVHNYQVRRSETGTGNGLSIYFEKKKTKNNNIYKHRHYDEVII